MYKHLPYRYIESLSKAGLRPALLCLYGGLGVDPTCYIGLCHVDPMHCVGVAGNADRLTRLLEYARRTENGVSMRKVAFLLGKRGSNRSHLQVVFPLHINRL